MEVKPKRISTQLTSKDEARTAKNYWRFVSQKYIKRELPPVVSEVFCYELPASSFPRYKYFRDLLQRFVPRFERTIEHGQLPEFSESETYVSIREDIDKFGNIVYVYLETKNDTEKEMFEKEIVKSKPTKMDSKLVKKYKLGTLTYTPTGAHEYNLKCSARNNLQKPYRNKLTWIYYDEFTPIFGLFFLQYLIFLISKILNRPSMHDFKCNPREHSTVAYGYKRMSRANKYDFQLTYEKHLLCQTDDAPTSICLQQSSIKCNLPQNTVWYSVSESELGLYTADGEKHAGSLGDVIQQFLERNVVSVFENILDFTKIILRENYDQDNSELTRVIKSVERLQFEILGILRQSSLDLKDTIPRNPVVTNEMKEDIMKLQDVLGCGTFLGVFTIFFSGKCNCEKDVEKILQKYKYTHKYRIETEAKISKCANPIHSSGNVIRAKGKPPYEEREKYGTLGCFVKLRQQNNEEFLEKSDLYFITCAHCVNDCQELVDIKDKEKFVPFGKTRHTLFDGDLVRDIAFIEVLRDHVGNCNTSVSRSCGILSTKIWNFFGESVPDGLPVYKVGSSSNITQGVVASANDVRFVNQEGQQSGSSDENLLFINPVETLDNQESFFSESGDSGSIVCTDDRDHVDRVKVVSLLSGTIETKTRSDGQENQDEQRELSYSFHLQNAIRDAEEEHDFRAEPAVDEEDGEEGATGGIRRLF